MSVLDDGRPLEVATERERIGQGPWARLFASAVVGDEGSSSAEHGRALARGGSVHTVSVTEGLLGGRVDDDGVEHTAEIAADPVPPRIWAAASRSARGNPQIEAAVAGRSQSVQLEHVLAVDWEEPLVPATRSLRRTCSCGRPGTCAHLAALAYALADRIDREPSLLLRWRGCTEPVGGPSPHPPSRSRSSRATRSGRRDRCRSSARRGRSARCRAEAARQERDPGRRPGPGRGARARLRLVRRLRAARRSRRAPRPSAVSASIGTTSSARTCVAPSTTGGATPASSASSQRDAQTHQRSPGCRPSKPHSGRGVERSFPAARLKARNSSVTTAQTVWLPRSSGPVAQQPSRKKPVSGAVEQGRSSPPTTFTSGSRPGALTSRSACSPSGTDPRRARRC